MQKARNYHICTHMDYWPFQEVARVEYRRMTWKKQNFKSWSMGSQSTFQSWTFHNLSKFFLLSLRISGSFTARPTNPKKAVNRYQKLQRGAPLKIKNLYLIKGLKKIFESFAGTCRAIIIGYCHI